MCSPVADYLYGSSSPPQTTALPDCGSASQPPPALLPASLDWPLEEKQLPDLFAAKVRGGHRNTSDVEEGLETGFLTL